MHKIKVNNKNLLNLIKKIQFFDNNNCKLVSTQITTEKTAKNTNFEPEENSNLNFAGTSTSNHLETSTSTSTSTKISKTSIKFDGSSLTNSTSTSPPTSIPTSFSTSTSTEILQTSEKFTGSSITNSTSTSIPTSFFTSTSTSTEILQTSEKFSGSSLTNSTSTSSPTSFPTSFSTSTSTSTEISKTSEKFTELHLTNSTSTSPLTSIPTSTSTSVKTSKTSENFSKPPLTNSTSTSIPTSIPTSTSTSKTSKKFSGPSLSDFISTSLPTSTSTSYTPTSHPYLPPLPPQAQKVYFDVYGCQMNVSDTEIVYSILKSAGYQRTLQPEEADVILVMTCAIRDGAEQKVWGRLASLNDLRRRRHFIGSPPLRVGLLGCMAERLKKKILEESKYVDLVAGPDAYRDLPRLLTVTDGSAINVALSFDETYADINPVRLNGDSKSAFVTIMRGCDNMCTYCIVPFVRGRERSRPMQSILDEVRYLADSGVKEVTLLGQNVNSYRDLSEEGVVVGGKPAEMAKGFKTVYKKKIGGKRFADLLEKVAEIDPEMRIRFTSPHPKDFPDEVLSLISSTPNICKQIHLPAQSGNSSVLERMRRGYTRESYLDLVQHIRDLIPTIQLSSDFIAGFCGETDAEFEDTMTLIDQVEYHMAYLFHYSMREKTTAHRRYQDDVPPEVKLQRHHRMSDLFRSQAERLNKKLLGTKQLVLIEGVSRRSDETLQGRTDGNTRVLIPNIEVPDGEIVRGINAGEYVEVEITSANSNSMTGVPLCHSSIKKFNCCS